MSNLVLRKLVPNRYFFPAILRINFLEFFFDVDFLLHALYLPAEAAVLHFFFALVVSSAKVGAESVNADSAAMHISFLITIYILNINFF